LSRTVRGVLLFSAFAFACGRADPSPPTASRSIRVVALPITEPVAPDDGSVPSAPLAPPPDACHPADDPRNVHGSRVFLGEFVATMDDDESGYAHALRGYTFKPLQAWRGLASAKETGGVLFLPNASDPPPRAVPPRFRRGQQVLVVVDRGGMSGKMEVISEMIPREAARARIEALGPPCWTR